MRYEVMRLSETWLLDVSENAGCYAHLDGVEKRLQCVGRKKIQHWDVQHFAR